VNCELFLTILFAAKEQHFHSIAFGNRQRVSIIDVIQPRLLSPPNSRAHQRESQLVPLRVVVFKVFGSPPEIPRWDPEKSGTADSVGEFIFAAKIRDTYFRDATNGFAERLFLRR